MLRKTIAGVVAAGLLLVGIAVISFSFMPSADARRASFVMAHWTKEIGKLGPLQQRSVRENGSDVRWYFGECVHPTDPTSSVVVPTVKGPRDIFDTVGPTVSVVKLPRDPGTDLITVYTDGGEARAEEELRYYSRTRPDVVFLLLGSTLLVVGVLVALHAGGWVGRPAPAASAQAAFPV